METTYTYAVTLGVVIELTIPPDHPDFKKAVLENAVERVNLAEEYVESVDERYADLVDTADLVGIEEKV